MASLDDAHGTLRQELDLVEHALGVAPGSFDMATNHANEYLAEGLFKLHEALAGLKALVRRLVDERAPGGDSGTSSRTPNHDRDTPARLNAFEPLRSTSVPQDPPDEIPGEGASNGHSAAPALRRERARRRSSPA